MSPEKQRRMQQESGSQVPTYKSVDVNNPSEHFNGVEQLLANSSHLNLPQVYSEFLHLTRLLQASKKTTNVRTDPRVVQEHILKKSWSTSFVIMEELMLSLPSTSTSCSKQKRIRPEDEPQESKPPAKQNGTSSHIFSRFNFRQKCSIWNKTATEHYWIYRISHSIGECPAILFVKKDCVDTKLIPGQLVLVKDPTIVKRKQRCDEFLQIENSILPPTALTGVDSGDAMGLTQEQKSEAPIGLQVKTKGSLYILGTATNYGLCKHVTYGAEYEDKLAYEALLRTNEQTKKKSSHFLADVVKCYTAINTELGSYCIRHVEKRSDQVCGTRLELSGVSMLRTAIPQQTDGFTKPVVFLLSHLNEELQLFIDPRINAKLQQRREAIAENQKRKVKRFKPKQNPAISAAILENLNQMQQNSRGAQLILEENKKICERAIEKRIIKQKGVKLTHSPKSIASQLMKAKKATVVPMLGRGLNKESTITFDLSSSEDEDDSSDDDEVEPECKRKKKA